MEIITTMHTYASAHVISIEHYIGCHLVTLDPFDESDCLDVLEVFNCQKCKGYETLICAIDLRKITKTKTITF